MPQAIYCHECQKYYTDYVDRKLDPADANVRFVDTDSQVGQGKMVVRNCPKGHMLDIGTNMGMHGAIIPRGRVSRG